VQSTSDNDKEMIDDAKFDLQEIASLKFDRLVEVSVGKEPSFSCAVEIKSKADFNDKSIDSRLSMLII
jgi:hypothetical protein